MNIYDLDKPLNVGKFNLEIIDSGELQNDEIDSSTVTRLTFD